MISLLIVMMVTCTLHKQVFCREDFILASDINNFYTRPIESTASFTSFPKPHLVGPVGHGIMYDTTYDPMTDKIYWIEKYINWISQSDPKICPTTIAIGRCDFDGTNSEVVIEGINNGTQCIPSVKPAIELDTKSRRLYWSSVDINGNVLLQTSTIEGTDIETLGERAVGYTDISIDEHSGDIFWLAGYDIHRVDQEGDIEVVVKGHPFSQVGISSISVDLQGNLFWTTSLPATVSRSTLQGTNTMLLFETPDEDFQFARDICLYRDSIYFVQRTENQSSAESDIYLMNKDGSTSPVVQPISFSLTSLHIYFTAATAAASPDVLTTTTAAAASTSTNWIPLENNQTMYISLAIPLSILVAVVIIVPVIYHRMPNGKKNRKAGTKDDVENPPLQHTYYNHTLGANADYDGYDVPADTNQSDVGMQDQRQASEDNARPYEAYINTAPGLSSVTNASGENQTMDEDRVGNQEDLKSMNPSHEPGDITTSVYGEPALLHSFMRDPDQD